MALICFTILIKFLVNSYNYHTLPRDRLESYQKSLEVINKGIPEVKANLNINAEVKNEPKTKD